MNSNAFISVLVVDDEHLAAERMTELVNEVSGFKVIGQAANSKQALELMQTLQPQLVFLDISMPGISGLELAKILQKSEDPPYIIFCTAYDQHALKAFEANATDYLVKPVRRERLLESLERIVRLKNSRNETQPKQYISVTVGGALRRIALHDIYYFHAEGNHTMVFHRGGEHLLSEPLIDLEQRYADLFFRIHRNCLVKSDQLLEIRRDNAGQTWAILREGVKPLEVSRRCASELKDKLKQN